jgi:AmmeMemoRadiSam system protein B
LFQKPIDIKTEALVSEEELTGTHSLIFYEPTLFIRELQLLTKEEDNKLVGGIIPHHLLPAGLLARFFNKLSQQDIQTYILIGPNHHEKGASKVLTSDWGWQTSFGIVKPDMKRINKMKAIEPILIDHEVLEHEHSVAGMMSYIKYFSPKARVIPLVISNTLNLSEIEKLTNKLTAFIDERTVVIASVDFSHYLRSAEAEAHDKITVKAMQSYDYTHIMRMNNDYLDSPSSIVLLLSLMKRMGTTNQIVFENTNSGRILSTPYVSTTSYFSIGFTK